MRWEEFVVHHNNNCCVVLHLLRMDMYHARSLNLQRGFHGLWKSGTKGGATQACSAAPEDALLAMELRWFHHLLVGFNMPRYIPALYRFLIVLPNQYKKCVLQPTFEWTLTDRVLWSKYRNAMQWCSQNADP